MFSFTMNGIARRNKSRGHKGARSLNRRARLGVEALEVRVVLSGFETPYLQTNLVSDIQGLAQVTDSNLANPWGVSFSGTSPFWVSNQHTSTSTLYAVTPAGVTKLGLTVAIPKTASGPQGPTGQVNNNTSSFLVNGSPAFFIFANLNGTISAWNLSAGKTAQVEATTANAVFTGLAIATNTEGSFLYAADDAQGRIDVFDGSFKPHDFGPNTFVDPFLAKGLEPFNIQLINGDLFVTYAPVGHANQVAAKPGQGAVAAFTTSGKFLEQLISGSTLAAPWGITLAPAGFGQFSGDLLVGNFAYNDSVINAFDPSTGEFRGTLQDASGHQIANSGLWSLKFGNGVNGGDPNTLYFTAGIDAEQHGLFGAIQAIPPLSRDAPIVPNLPNGAFQSLTTIPPSGDLNPYGVAFVPPGFPTGGSVNPGDILVSNFNSSANQQGTGSTIVDIGPSGQQSVFFQGKAGLGLTTALGILKGGFVLVGNLPATYDAMGNLLSIGQGSLLILDKNGNVVETLSDSKLLDRPWDLTVNDEGDHASVFVSNVLDGVVTRIDLTIPDHGSPVVESMTQIASGYLTRTDPAALVVGPTGLAFDPEHDVLFVASTGDNEIFAIPRASDRTSDAGMGHLVYNDPAHLHGPLGLALAPNGDLITSNGDAVNPDPTQNSELVEFTRGGQFVGQFSVDSVAGSAFGLAVTNVGGLLRVAAVDDNTNSLHVWTFQTGKSHSESEDDGGDASLAPGGAGSTSPDTGSNPSTGTSESAPSSPGTSTTVGANVTPKEHGTAASHRDLIRSARTGRQRVAHGHKKHKPNGGNGRRGTHPHRGPTSPEPPIKPMPYYPGY
jgi:uncharacterized protein (TIGR03118 family)